MGASAMARYVVRVSVSYQCHLLVVGGLSLSSLYARAVKPGSDSESGAPNFQCTRARHRRYQDSKN